MAQLNSLQDVGNSRKPILNYIITDSKTTVKNQDVTGAGNIVIYIGDDSTPVVINEKDSTSYTHLYVGDEHIAGGFGFKNLNDLDKAYQLFDKVEEIEHSISDIEKSEANPGEYNSSNQLTIDKVKNKIKTENAEYRFDIDQNVGKLTITADTNEKIINLENNKFSIPPEINVCELGEPEDLNNTNISSLEFDYIGDEEIYGLYISAKRTENEYDLANSISEDLCGTQQNPLLLTEVNNYVTINVVSNLKDPELDPEVFQQHWKLSFKSSFNTLLQGKSYHKGFNRLQLKLHLLTKGLTRKLTKTFIDIVFVAPVYYYTSNKLSSIPNPLHKATELSVVKILDLPGNSTTLTFPTNSNADAYQTVFINGKTVDKVGIDFIYKDTGMKIKWEQTSGTDTVLKNGQHSNYVTFYAPHPYTTSKYTSWILNFTKK